MDRGRSSLILPQTGCFVLVPSMSNFDVDVKMGVAKKAQIALLRRRP